MSTICQSSARIGDREVGFAPAELADHRGCVKLGHAYATTCFGAQGLTTNEALVWVDAGLDRHDAFVAASRARETTRLFVDRVSLDAAVRQNRSLSEWGRPVEADERRIALARLLARSGEKGSTLDYPATIGMRQEPIDLPRSVGVVPETAAPAVEQGRPSDRRPTRDRRRGKGLALGG